MSTEADCPELLWGSDIHLSGEYHGRFSE